MPVGTPQFKGEELGIPFGPTNFFEMFVGPQVPDPITFVLGEKWLNRPHMLYPRQATLLKLIFLRDDLFTPYDDKVIDEWEESFRLTGTKGISPGIRERITWLKEQGAKWFREVLLVMGRRAGKGYVSGVALSYVIWNYMARGNPQEYYGIDRDKRISCLVFAGKRDQAKATVFGDVVNAITSSTCFAPYISKTQTESMTLYAPSDFIRMDNMRRKGIKTQRDIASLEILPKESTPMAGRGPSAFTLAFDEMAHVVAGSGTSSNADAVYCLERQTPVLMADGSYRPIGDVRVGDRVLSSDESGSGRLVETGVTNRWDFEEEEFFEIEREDGQTIRCSGNHRWLTQRGWVRTDELVEGDDIVEAGARCGTRNLSDRL